MGTVIGLVRGAAHLANKVRHKLGKRRTKVSKSDDSALVRTAFNEILATRWTPQQTLELVVRMQQEFNQTLESVVTMQQEFDQTTLSIIHYYTQLIIYLFVILAALMYILGYYQADYARLTDLPKRIVQLGSEFHLPRSIHYNQADPVFNGVLLFINAVFDGFLCVSAAILYCTQQLANSAKGNVSASLIWTRSAFTAILHYAPQLTDTLWKSIAWVYQIAMGSLDKLYGILVAFFTGYAPQLIDSLWKSIAWVYQIAIGSLDKLHGTLVAFSQVTEFLRR